MSGPPVVVLAGGIVGEQLAGDPVLATLPIAGFVVGNAVATLPVVFAMQRFGRKALFLLMASVGAAGAVLGGLSILLHSFWLLTAAAFVQGSAGAAAQQYRFAAIESVEPEHGPTAAARVLLGGLVAAFLGPEVAFRFRHLFAVEWAGSFFVSAILYLLALIVLLSFRPLPIPPRLLQGETGRPLARIAATPTFLAAVVASAGSFAIMSYVMTATPVHMHAAHFSAEETKTVLQSHIVAMFLPSLFSGFLIEKLGTLRLMAAGVMLYAVTIAVGAGAREYLPHWVALVLLGVGWNFLFLSGTSLLPSAHRPEEKFKVQALNDFITFGVQALAATMAGVMLARAGWQALVYSTVPIMLLQVAVFAWWRSHLARASGGQAP